jgi:hypothetical protein
MGGAFFHPVIGIQGPCRTRWAASCLTHYLTAWAAGRHITRPTSCRSTPAVLGEAHRVTPSQAGSAGQQVFSQWSSPPLTRTRARHDMMIDQYVHFPTDPSLDHVARESAFRPGT